MIIRRLRLTLPPGMRATAAHDARHLAEALAHELSRRGIAQSNITLALPAAGQNVVTLAPRLTATLPAKGGSHGR